MIKVGEALKAIRKSRGISQRKLAYKANVSMFTISSIEQGRLTGTIEMLNKLCEALGTNIAYLFISSIEYDDLNPDKADEFLAQKNDILYLLDNEDNSRIDENHCHSGERVCQECGRSYDPSLSDADEYNKFCCLACEYGC